MPLKGEFQNSNKGWGCPVHGPDAPWWLHGTEDGKSLEICQLCNPEESPDLKEVD